MYLSSGGVITGIVIGGIVLVAVGVGLFAYFVYYFKQKKIRGQVVHAPAPVVISTGLFHCLLTGPSGPPLVSPSFHPVSGNVVITTGVSHCLLTGPSGPPLVSP